MGIGKTVVINEQALASDINKMSGWGAIGARPNTEGVLAGSFYYDTTNSILYQEQNGSWVAVLQTKTLNPANEIVEAGYYAVTTLSAVDADLAVGNIKKDVNIFGKVGTFERTLAEDIKGLVKGTDVENNNYSPTRYYRAYSVAIGADQDLASITQAYDTSSLAVGSGLIDHYGSAQGPSSMRLYMGGVEVASVALSSGRFAALIATRALSGAGVICKVSAHNDFAGTNEIRIHCEAWTPYPILAVVMAGSVKLV